MSSNAPSLPLESLLGGLFVYSIASKLITTRILYPNSRNQIHAFPFCPLLFVPEPYPETLFSSIIPLCIELLLIRLHVHVALQLSAGSAKLKSQHTVGSRLLKLLQAFHAAVLHGVLQASSKVGNELGDRSDYMSARDSRV